MDYPKILKPGIRVVASNIEESEELHGTVAHYDDEQKILEMKDVYDSAANYQYDSEVLIHLFNYDLKIYEDSLKSLDKNENGDVSSCSSKETNEMTEGNSSDPSNVKVSDGLSSGEVSIEESSDESEAENKEVPGLPCVLKTYELNTLKDLLKTTTLLNNADDLFEKAMDILNKEKEFSLTIELTSHKGKDVFSLICIATWNNVFIFDLKNLKPMYKGLKHLLQRSYSRKIIFNSEISIFFKRILDITLEDVVNLSCQNIPIKQSDHRGNRALRELIIEVLKVPSEFFTERSTHKKDVNVKNLAELAVFQLKLWDYHVHGVLLKDFYERCQSYSRVFHGKNNCQTAVLIMQQFRTIGMDSIKWNDDGWRKHMKTKKVTVGSGSH